MRLNTEKINILLTGGGTGGHTQPLILVAKELKKTAQEKGSEINLKYIGPKSDFEVLLKKEEIAVDRIISAKLRRYFSFWNLVDVFKFFWAVGQSLIKVFIFKPNVVFSKGGTGSLPILLACRIFNVPIVIHESDSVPSLTNKIAASWAKIIEVGFASVKPYFEKISRAKINITGNPIDVGLLKPIDQKEARQSFNLDLSKKTILIMGGSQGSQRINKLIFSNLEVLLNNYQIIHQTGKQNFLNYELGIRNYGKEFNGYYFTDYFENNLTDAYAAADVVICRAGAQTIFELAALSKPAILIPLPESAQDHQRKNAYEYAKTGDAIVIEEKDLNINLLEKELTRASQLSPVKNFYNSNSAKIVVNDILMIVGL